MTIDGNWELFLSPVAWCYHGADPGFSYTLVSIHYPRRDTRKSQPSGGINYDRLKGSKIYVARLNRQGHTAMARPCEQCYRMLREAGVIEIVYTVDRRNWRREWLNA